MLILMKAVLAMMIGFITAIVIGLVLIPYLKKHQLIENVNDVLKDKHGKKNGTPLLGGLIFILATIIVTFVFLLMGKIHLSSNLLIVIFVLLAYALLGLVDDLISIKHKNNEGLTPGQKLIGQLIITLIFFYVFIANGGEPVLDIHTLGININMGWTYGLFLLLVLIGSSNAVNITDGLDGLAGGLSMISFLAVGIIAWGSTWVAGYQDIAIFCFVIAGSLLGFLFFNSYPAKVFMGDTGSLALGAAMATVAILTNHELTLLLIAGVFVIETLSAIIQMVASRYFHKWVFLMAPLHHHFEKLGWAEPDIVKLFYFFGLVFNMIAIAFGVWI